MNNLYKKFILNNFSIQHNDKECKAAEHFIDLYKCVPATRRMIEPSQYMINTPYGLINTDNIVIGYSFNNNIANVKICNNMTGLKVVDPMHCKVVDPHISFKGSIINIQIYDYAARGYFIYYKTDCLIMDI